ncbi:YmdB family metallophosphoesterase [Candidatus Dojkabacteria bacterium]|nr:YmdB family metallophosphoesterase [Candidatus Dojkabacteria bacterium]
MIKVLFIGDVCGKPGREAISQVLPSMKRDLDIDLVLCDVENIAHGRGVTEKTIKEVMSYGVDFMTGGNHIWRRSDFWDVIEGQYPIIRALNYPEDIPGKGFDIIDLGTKGKIVVALLQGRAFMQDQVITDMIRPLENLIEKVKEIDDLSGFIVEIHAEATSEKIAPSLHFDGNVSAFIGSHTHVPSADERILPKGSGYITDVGMVGPMNSSLWVQADIVFQQMKYPYAPSYEIEENGPIRFDSVLFEIGDDRLCKSIKRVNKVL